MLTRTQELKLDGSLSLRVTVIGVTRAASAVNLLSSEVHVRKACIKEEECLKISLEMLVWALHVRYAPFDAGTSASCVAVAAGGTT